MNILLTGAAGQVGYELARCLQPLGQVVALTRAQLDLADLARLREVVRAVGPGLIVNAAAYTNVERAESDAALAHRINAEAPAVMAAEARLIGAAMVHYSTDYVFDGSKQGAYVETDPANPLNVYGRSKLLGEQAVANAGIDHLILRTSWVYGKRGHNFLQTMLRRARAGEPLTVVDDQHGAPTWSRTVADTTAHVLTQAQDGGRAWWHANSGLYHLACQGETTWHGFAQAILDCAGIDQKVIPISSADYPQKARRPAHSLLNSDKLRARFCRIPDWRDALCLCLQ